MMLKPIKLPGGHKLTHGQIILKNRGDNTMMQRPLNTAFKKIDPRNGAEKRIVDAQPVPGMKRQTAPSALWMHGAPALDDEKEQPIKSHEKPIAVHPSMTPKQKAAHEASPKGATIFAEAAKLGRTDK